MTEETASIADFLLPLEHKKKLSAPSIPRPYLPSNSNPVQRIRNFPTKTVNGHCDLIIITYASFNQFTWYVYVHNEAKGDLQRPRENAKRIRLNLYNVKRYEKQAITRTKMLMGVYFMFCGYSIAGYFQHENKQGTGKRTKQQKKHKEVENLIRSPV